MRKEIISPEVETRIPDAPSCRIDSGCSADGTRFADRVGNTFDCGSGISFWTDGISDGVLVLDRSPINAERFSMSICFTGRTRYPLVFGDRLTGGLWLELDDAAYRFSSGEGTMFSHPREEHFTFALTKDGSRYRFFHDGVGVSESSCAYATTGRTTVTIDSGARLVNLLMYDRILSDAEVADLYRCDFRGSLGLDHLGFRNTVQSFNQA